MPQEEKQRSSKRYNRNQFQTFLFLPHLLCPFNDLQHHVISPHPTPTIFLNGAPQPSFYMGQLFTSNIEPVVLSTI